jgi:hypothetical protein
MQMLGMEASSRKCPLCRQPMTGTSLADYTINFSLRDALAVQTDAWLLPQGSVQLPPEPFVGDALLGRGSSGVVVKGAQTVDRFFFNFSTFAYCRSSNY